MYLQRGKEGGQRKSVSRIQHRPHDTLIILVNYTTLTPTPSLPACRTVGSHQIHSPIYKARGAWDEQSEHTSRTQHCLTYTSNGNYHILPASFGGGDAAAGNRTRSPWGCMRGCGCRCRCRCEAQSSYGEYHTPPCHTQEASPSETSFKHTQGTLDEQGCPIHRPLVRSDGCGCVCVYSVGV